MSRADEIRDIQLKAALKKRQANETEGQKDARERTEMLSKVKSEIPGLFEREWVPQITEAAQNGDQVRINIGPIEADAAAERNLLILQHGVEFLKQPEQGFLASYTKYKVQQSNDDPGTVHGFLYIGWGRKIEFQMYDYF